MINFVNCGTDEAILKSLPIDGASDDLIKAMGKQGLVQKEVQVRGKNGKMFTRKQWVKAGEVQSTGKSTSKSPKVDEGYKFKVEDFENEDDYICSPKDAFDKAKDIAKKYGSGKVEKLGDYGFAFEADYKTCMKFVKDNNLEEYHDGYEDDEGFDYGTETNKGNLFCTQGGFQNDDRLLIGVAYNEL